ncbi:MAG: hypothetical protein QOD62_1981 [Actinomycetota bacterium]|nr:hypothetical protein [Actinomycetota bacterium]
MGHDVGVGEMQLRTDAETEGTRTAAVQPQGRHPRGQRPSDVVVEAVSDTPRIRWIDPEGVEGDLEDRRIWLGYPVLARNDYD